MGLLDSKKLAFVFPGQGSQVVGMGQSLADNFEVAKNLFSKADSALGFSISDICFNGPDDQLNQTLNTQPALFLTSAAAFEVFKEKGYNPLFLAGHSVGEYAALYAAGAFSFEDGIKLVRKRAELMQQSAQANPGTMAAILGLSPDQVREVVSNASDIGVVQAANFNSPIQTVISGEVDAVKKASELAAQAGAKRVVPLNVSGAFHSPLMQSAADHLLSELNSLNFMNLSIPVTANFTADFENTAVEVKNNLSKQITGSVRWVESIERMLDAGAEVFIELGTGNVLSGLIKRINKECEVISIGDKASLEVVLS